MYVISLGLFHILPSVLLIRTDQNLTATMTPKDVSAIITSDKATFFLISGKPTKMNFSVWGNASHLYYLVSHTLPLTELTTSGGSYTLTLHTTFNTMRRLYHPHVPKSNPLSRTASPLLYDPTPRPYISFCVTTSIYKKPPNAADATSLSTPSRTHGYARSVMPISYTPASTPRQSWTTYKCAAEVSTCSTSSTSPMRWSPIMVMQKSSLSTSTSLKIPRKV